MPPIRFSCIYGCLFPGGKEKEKEKGSDCGLAYGETGGRVRPLEQKETVQGLKTLQDLDFWGSDFDNPTPWLSCLGGCFLILLDSFI